MGAVHCGEASCAGHVPVATDTLGCCASVRAYVALAGHPHSLSGQGIRRPFTCSRIGWSSSRGRRLRGTSDPSMHRSVTVCARSAVTRDLGSWVDCDHFVQAAVAPPAPTVETLVRLGTSITFVTGVCPAYSGPMACLELSAPDALLSRHDKVDQLNSLLEHVVPRGSSCRHSGYACGVHVMSALPSVVGSSHNGRRVMAGTRMTLLSPTALCRLLPRLARQPTTSNAFKSWLEGGVGTPLEFATLEDFRRLPEAADALPMLVGRSRRVTWTYLCSSPGL
jgi:hypothetical protein